MTMLASEPLGVRAVLGYDRVAGVSWESYNEWLTQVHYPDLLSNPHLDSIVLHEVFDKVRDGDTFERLAELRFGSRQQYDDFVAWRRANPVAPERTPAGRTDFRFYLLCDSTRYSRARTER